MAQGQQQPYDVREYWSGVAESISNRSDGRLVAGLDTPFYEYKRDRFHSRFLRSIPARGRAVLEIGCGPGGNLLQIARSQPRRLVGCDISPSMIELARETTAGVDEVELVAIDGQTLPFADGEFDISFTATVLQHNPDEQLERLAAEICRVTGDAVYLFEDTTTRRRERYSAVLRPVDEYAAAFGRNGFELTQSADLRVFASETSAAVLRRVLNRRPPANGEPVSGLTMALERATLPVTTRLDPVVPQFRGLTKMVFRRRDGAAA